MKKYQIIYADPPWFFEGNYGKVGNTILSGFGASIRYKLMKSSEIVGLPISTIVGDNCALFLWCVNSQIPLAIEVIKRWGFDYKTVAFCWVKTAKETGIPNCRLGYWTLGGMELCLLGVRGGLKTECKNVRQVVLHRIGHSRKPQIFRDNIVKLFGDLPRIELFARQKTEGWDCIGNEINGKDIKQQLEEMISGQTA